MPAVCLFVAAVKVDSLVAELKSYNIHIGSIQETKRTNGVWYLAGWWQVSEWTPAKMLSTVPEVLN